MSVLSGVLRLSAYMNLTRLCAVFRLCRNHTGKGKEKADFSGEDRPIDREAGTQRQFAPVSLVLHLITCRWFHGVRS